MRNLASEIPSSNVEPESYLEATKTTFSLIDPPVSVVRKLSAKLNERKAASLDNIPSRLLKMAGNIIAPSLTQIFIKSINTGIFPTEWELARVTPIFKKGGTEQLSTNIHYSDRCQSFPKNYIRPAL